MKFTNNMYIKLAVTASLILGMGATSFAGNTISDVPASANEVRTIQRETSLYTDSCEITQNLAFYDKSPVYLRVKQPKGPVSYVFDKAETYVRIYNQSLFEGNLRFPYVANFVPSSTIESDSSDIFTVEATGANFAADDTIERDEIAGQIVTKNIERTVFQNANGSTLNYYYKLANTNFTPKNGTLKVIINTTTTPKTSCTNYYVARCGDGVKDDANSQGIEVDGDTINRHARSLEPNEVCDDGEENGQPGKCKTDCSGIAGGNPGGATCTLSATPATIEAGQTTTINAGYTSGASASFSPSISGFASFTTPTWNGSTTTAPTTTTTYTMNVAGANGLSGTSCSTTVTVTQPTPHLTCNLSFSQNPTVPGNIVNVSRHVANGSFVGTPIYVTPDIPGWPHNVNANQHDGLTQAIPGHTGDYLFSFHIFNNDNTQTTTCTGLLHVIDNIPARCTLTTSTPLVAPGAAGLLNASYTNAVLATITPSIAGLNFLYPNRSRNNIVVHPTQTTTYTMNVKNVFGSGSTCTATINVLNTGVVISKTVLDNRLYHSGDLVSFKITFANRGPSTINHVILRDVLPGGLEYVSSNLFGVAPYSSSHSLQQGSMVVIYSGFSLAPGQEGYLTVVGRFKGYEYADQILNTASLRSDTSEPVYASAFFQAYKPNANATITKTADRTTYYPGQDGRFTLAVTNNGPDVISNIQITDYRPQNMSCVSANSHRYANVPLSMTNTMNPYTRRYTGSLAAGETIYLYITGHMSNDPACIGSYVNNAGISYFVNGQLFTGTAPEVPFTISTTPASAMDFEKRIVAYGNNSGDPVIFELLYHNNGTATITHFEVVDYRPGTLNFIAASPMPTTQSLTPEGSILRWIFNTPLAPDGSGKIIINGTIK